MRRDDHRPRYYVGACVSLRELKAIMVDIGSEAWTYEPCAEGFTRRWGTVPGVFAAVRTLEEDAACSGVPGPNNNKACQICAGLARAHLRPPPARRVAIADLLPRAQSPQISPELPARGSRFYNPPLVEAAPHRKQDVDVSSQPQCVPGAGASSPSAAVTYAPTTKRSLLGPYRSRIRAAMG